jgi:hypothetical protein
MQQPYRCRRPRILFVILYFLFAAHASLQVFAANGGALFILALLIASTATAWVAIDSRLRKQPIQHGVQLVFLLTWPVSLPFYLIKTRGFTGVGLAFAHFVGLVGAYSIFSALSAAAAGVDL